MGSPKYLLIISVRKKPEQQNNECVLKSEGSRIVKSASFAGACIAHAWMWITTNNAVGKTPTSSVYD